MLAAIFDAFIEASPVSVMLRGVMEKEAKLKALKLSLSSVTSAFYR